jgi:hypothetical protein
MLKSKIIVDTYRKSEKWNWTRRLAMNFVVPIAFPVAALPSVGTTLSPASKGK